MGKTVNDYFSKEDMSEISELAGQINRGEEVEVDKDVENTEAIDNVDVDTDTETEAKDKSFKDDPSNQVHAEKRRREEIDALRAKLKDKDDVKENTEEDLIAKKVEELLNKKDEAKKAESDFKNKQQELNDKYEETGEVKYLEEKIRNDIKKEVTTNDSGLSKKEIKEMIAAEFSKNNEIDQIGSELKELNKEFNLNFKSFEALLKSENGDKVIELAEGGLNLSDAYLLANKDLINKKKSISNSIKDARRSHMKTTKSGAGSVNNSSEPDALDLQIMRAAKMDSKSWKAANKKYNK